MTTNHQIVFGNSASMKEVEDESIDLVVTSPPYPMYDMWDVMFTNMNEEIGDCLKTNPMRAFELQHRELDRVWDECIRVLKDGCYLIIDIADAPRSFNKDFQLFDNHSRIVTYLTMKGLKELPPIMWHKPTNAPNKFMGCGCLCGAYVTSEHEHILIFRKGTKRTFTDEERNSEGNRLSSMRKETHGLATNGIYKGQNRRWMAPEIEVLPTHWNCLTD